MLLIVWILIQILISTEQRHFNGGTINWAAVNPYDNSSTVIITITQTYSWTTPNIKCANNVPISTSGWGSANTNLKCVTDCLTDGGYSANPIDILTDCTSVSTSLNMLSSTRSKNVTLNENAHFYLAYVGNAWVALNYPRISNSEWSIVTFIDIRRRSDGRINTPPVAKIISPQYAYVNQTVQINIPVSDADTTDDVRCRWSKYTSGYRRKRSDEKKPIVRRSILPFLQTEAEAKQILGIRKKRGSCEEEGCLSECDQGCKCQCSPCDEEKCSGERCSRESGCNRATTVSSTTKSTTRTTTTTTSTRTTTTTTTRTTTTTTTRTTTTSTSTTTTELETVGTLKSTSSYPTRQALDECGDICFPSSAPNGTNLSDCTITFTGTRAGTWYALAIQVEDFMNSSSTEPMSSTPVQFLIYVMPLPVCSKVPVILPVNDCLEVQVGSSVTFRLYVINFCNTNVATITDIIISSEIDGMSTSNLTAVPTNTSLSYITLTWIPKVNQIGYQELCAIAFTSEKLQSAQYCEIFTVKNTPDLCVTTTTTSTTSTTVTSTTTSATTTTTSTSSTSTTTTTITTTTTSETTTTTTTSDTTTTSTTSTSTTTTSTSTTTTTTTTTTTITTTTTSSTTSTTTSTTSITTTTTSTTTTTTSTTTSTSTTSTTTSTTTTTTSTTSTTTSTTTTTTSTTTTSTTTTTTSTTTSTTTTTTSTTSTTTSTTTTTTSTATTSTTTTTTSTSTTSTTTSTSTTSTSTTTTSVTTTTATTATTSLKNVPKTHINWLLITGLSLLALLMTICCCCCYYFYYYRLGPFRRRRKSRTHETQVTNLRGKTAATRTLQRSFTNNNSSMDDILSKSDFHLSLNASSTTMINSNTTASAEQMGETETCNETKDANLTIIDDNNSNKDNNSTFQSVTVTVLPRDKKTSNRVKSNVIHLLTRKTSKN